MDHKKDPPQGKTYTWAEWTSLKPSDMPKLRPIQPGASRMPGSRYNPTGSRFQRNNNNNNRGRGSWTGGQGLGQPGTSKRQHDQEGEPQPWWVKAQKVQQNPGKSRQGPWRWRGRGGCHAVQGQQGGQPQQRLMAGQRWGPRIMDELSGEDEERENRPYGSGSDEEDDSHSDNSGYAVDWKNYGATRKQKLRSQYQDNVEFHQFVVEWLRREPRILKKFRAILNYKHPIMRNAQPTVENCPFRKIDEDVGRLIDQLMFSRVDDPIRKLFQGVCIYVNGYTYPTADVLMQLMQLSGGEFTWSFEPQRTTHTIATVLSVAQKKRQKALLTTVRPDWILDSLKAKKLLHIHEYKVIKPKNDIKKMFERIMARQAEERERALQMMQEDPEEPMPPEPKQVVDDQSVLQEEIEFVIEENEQMTNIENHKEIEKEIENEKEIQSKTDSELTDVDSMSQKRKAQTELRVIETNQGKKESVLVPKLFSLYDGGELEDLFGVYTDDSSSGQPNTSTPVQPCRSSRMPFGSLMPVSQGVSPIVPKPPLSPEILTFLTPPKAPTKATPIPRCYSPELITEEMEEEENKEATLELPASLDLFFDLQPLLPPKESPKKNITTTVIRVASDDEGNNDDVEDEICEPPPKMTDIKSKPKKELGTYDIIKLNRLKQDKLYREFVAGYYTANTEKKVAPSTTAAATTTTATSINRTTTNAPKLATTSVSANKAPVSTTINTKPIATVSAATSAYKPPEPLLKYRPVTASTILNLPTYPRNQIRNAGLPPSKLRKAKPDDKHFVEVEPFIPSSMTDVDQEMLAQLPDDIRREITGYIRQKSANMGKVTSRVIPGNMVRIDDPNDPRVAERNATRRAQITKQQTTRLFDSKQTTVSGKAPAAKQPIFANRKVAGPKQLRLDTMLLKAKEKKEEKELYDSLSNPEKKTLHLYFGGFDDDIGPNLCGQTKVKPVLKILKEWILSESDLTDDDVSYLLKYFAGLVDTNKHEDLITILWKVKHLILIREAKGGLECATWKTLFFETFPAFLNAEPTFKSKIPRKLFWFAKEETDKKRPPPSKRSRKS